MWGRLEAGTLRCKQTGPLGHDVLLQSGEYLRTSAVEYLGGYQAAQGPGEKFLLAYVEAPGQNVPRQVRWIVVDALHCTWGDAGRLTEELDTVQWLNAGGYVPAGYQSFVAYPRQAWLAASTRGSATQSPEIKLYRFVSEADSGLWADVEEFFPDIIFSPTHIERVSPEGMLPDMAPSLPLPQDSEPLEICIRSFPWIPPFCVHVLDSQVSLLVAYGGEPVWRDYGAGDLEHMCVPEGAHSCVYPKDSERTDRALHVECEPAVGGRCQG